MESLRQNTIIHEIDPATEIEFPGPAAPGETKSDQTEPDLLARIELLWQRRRQLSRLTLCAVAVSTVIVLLIPNQYESSARIMPPDPMSNAGGMLAALGGKVNPELMALASTMLGMKSSGALFVDLFRSRSVQERVVDRLDLQKVYWARYKQDARKRLDNRTDISEDRKSGVITLTVQDRSPQRAHDIAQAYVEELNHLLAQVSTSSARRERIFIEQRLITVKNDLEDAEKQFGAFASKNTALDVKEEAKAMVESGARLQGELIAAEAQLQSLEQIYTANNVRVRALRSQVDELKRQLQQVRGTDSSLASDATNPDEMYPPVRKLPLLGVEWADLYRRAKIQETVYELLTQQYELARIQEAKEIPTINVVDVANMPERKSWPPRLLLISLLTLFSLAGGIAWIIATDRLDRLSPEDLRSVWARRLSDAVSRSLERGQKLIRRRRG